MKSGWPKVLDLSSLEIPDNYAVLKVFFFFFTMEGGSVGRGEPGSRGDRI